MRIYLCLFKLQRPNDVEAGSVAGRKDADEEGDEHPEDNGGDERNLPLAHLTPALNKFAEGRRLELPRLALCQRESHVKCLPPWTSSYQSVIYGKENFDILCPIKA